MAPHNLIKETTIWSNPSTAILIARIVQYVLDPSKIFRIRLVVRCLFAPCIRIFGLRNFRCFGR